jgi:hypothetical protein
MVKVGGNKQNASMSSSNEGIVEESPREEEKRNDVYGLQRSLGSSQNSVGRGTKAYNILLCDRRCMRFPLHRP